MLKYLLIFYPFFSGNLLIAQQFVTFSDYKEKESYKAITDQQIDYLFRVYNQRIDNSDEIINGREYFPYYFKSEINPLLFSGKKRSGSLIMNGKKYDNVSLEYDTYLDEVVYSDNTKFFNNKSLVIAVNSEEIDGFNLYFENDSLTFRNFRSGFDVNFNLPEGFYEVVYDGASKYIIKHKSTISKEKSLNAYLYSPTAYVMVGGDYSKLRSRRGFIKLFGVRSEEIRKFIRSNGVQIRRGEKNKIASVLRYYDTLILSDNESE